MSKKSVAVEIAGHRYKIRTDSDEDSVRSIADDVDRAMQRVREETGTVDSLDVAILTCLNLAREILVLRGQPEDSFEGERMRGLIERVESVVPELKIAASDSGTPKSLSGAGTETATVTGQTQPEAASEPPRTLELPGVEVLRESAQLSTSTL
ncbi:MAG: cell division protein ZapA, partial [Myxococcota bacterium]